MLRRLGREDLASVNPFLREKESRAPFLWHVYEDYEVVEEKDALPYLRASTPKGYETPRRVRSYNPLVDTPRLFLDFARIAERRNPAEALSQWIAQYGLLGFADSSPQWFPEGLPEVTVPPRMYDDIGGPGETLEAVWYEVYITNHILALYEDILRGKKRIPDDETNPLVSLLKLSGIVRAENDFDACGAKPPPVDVLPAVDADDRDATACKRERRRLARASQAEHEHVLRKRGN